MSEESSSLREPADAMTRQSGEVAEDVQPLTTHEDAEKTARGSLQGTAGPEGADTADNLTTE
jgi:hypothetical protein